MSCGVGCRRGSNLALLWLWCRLAAATLIRALAWEPPCAVSAALKRQKKKRVSTVSSRDWLLLEQRGVVVRERKRKSIREGFPGSLDKT